MGKCVDQETKIRANDQKLTMKYLEQTASIFHLELQLNQLNNNAFEQMEILLIPTESTFNIFERWTAIHQVYSSFPYPENRIQSQDWIGLNEFLYDEGVIDKIKSSKRYNLILDYIFGGNNSDHPIIEEAIKLIEGK